MELTEELLLRVMDDLRDCLCAQLEDGNGKGCFCGLYPGAQANADWCSCKSQGEGCGMAWVRLVRAFPSSLSYPSQDTKPGSCAVVLAAVIEVGVYRCMPVPDSRGNMDPVALANTAIAQVQDVGAMARAFACCEALSKVNPLLGVYQPTPPGGDCGGGTWPVTVQLMPR